eukprot:CAMPEP_0185598308 /NCGR_PEP_ID=MMETSP0434-20130131/81913_1 /TAXON_ID=626734 ORGANISM="Favella taraikaensis, Strain Fe Narragansett Bay" /NCGR_SAMPLE_ID=MMETSP0434 /ASSEMBLY_ACC=CAM_ASM_000379 /LENGTH=68 /DNA_ID=CAMNT_0028227251 /DNA_START=240 /DNA_END=446 /DNA_ORIENTATION=+
MNKLGQKHKNLNLNKVHGIAMTKAEKKRLLKKKARAEKFAKEQQGMDDDWVSASSDEEEMKQPKPAAA